MNQRAPLPPVNPLGPVAQLLRDKRVLVCCGAGGVGKTTVSASLALAAARAGRRVLVVTIDPSRRLAETLGVARNPAEPVALAAERLAAVGIQPPGNLSAWMLDPQRVSDKVVHNFSGSAESARTLLGNRIYRNVTAMVAGMQEYTAIEALHGFVRDDHYDLVVLDTPPSRNALRFLEAPDRVGSFLDRRIFGLFVPEEGNFIRRVASNLIERVMDIGFGEDTRRELQQFFIHFGALLDRLNRNQGEMRKFFQQPEVGFLLVTSPQREALVEAYYFEQKTRDELKLPLVGYILNRSLASAAGYVLPDAASLPPGAPTALRRALERLRPIAEVEAHIVQRHVHLAEELRARGGESGLAWVLPLLADCANDLEALDVLARALVADEDGSDAPRPTPTEATR